MKLEELVEKKSEGQAAFDAGYEDALAGRPRKNASDVYGPYAGKYSSGYAAGMDGGPDGAGKKSKLKEHLELHENVVIGGVGLGEIYDKVYKNLKIAKKLAAEIAKAIGHRIIVLQKEDEDKYKVIPFEVYDHWSRSRKEEWRRV